MFKNFAELRERLCSLVDNPVSVTMADNFTDLTASYLMAAGWEPRISSDDAWDDVVSVLSHTLARMIAE